MLKKLVMKEFYQTLKEIRTRCQLSQQFVADKLHVSRALISQWECNICEPSIKELKKLCIIFEISADELLEIETEQERNEVKKQMS